MGTAAFTGERIPGRGSCLGLESGRNREKVHTLRADPGVPVLDGAGKVVKGQIRRALRGTI